MLIIKHVAVKVSQEDGDLHLQSQLEPWSLIKRFLVSDGKPWPQLAIIKPRNVRRRELCIADAQRMRGGLCASPSDRWRRGGGFLQRMRAARVHVVVFACWFVCVPHRPPLKRRLIPIQVGAAHCWP